MFTSPLWCLCLGAIVCVALQNDSCEGKQQEVKEAIRKAILQKMNFKTPPKPDKKSQEVLKSKHEKKEDENEGCYVVTLNTKEIHQ